MGVHPTSPSDEERIGAKRKKKLQHFNQFFDGSSGGGFGRCYISHQSFWLCHTVLTCTCTHVCVCVRVRVHVRVRVRVCV